MAGARPEEQDPGDPDATVRVLQWHSQAAHPPKRRKQGSPDIRAIEVIDLDRNDQDNEQWRRVVKGTCVWMNVKEGDALVSIPMLGVIQRIFKDGKTIKVNINWLWDLKDVKIEGALHGMTVEAEMAGSSTSSHARREVFYSMDKEEMSAECILHPAKVTFSTEQLKDSASHLHITSNLGKGRTYERREDGFSCYRSYVHRERRLFDCAAWKEIQSLSQAEREMLSEEFHWLCRRSTAMLEMTRPGRS
ncbi:hypothetical protein WJX84_007271 [Apatococcus fuscideae]|uniref:BAH domain-containing protein n=1 Tax=Apatococcus fuscideae TaxID=2026836 RepID=A0AAW1RNT4_9CHLO